MWWTDGYGDYIKHFMAGMAAVPKWADNRNRLLKSTSVVRRTNYRNHSINYLTFDKRARETLKVTSAPVKVTAGGKGLQRRKNLGSPGWTYKPKSGVLRVFHRNARKVQIRLKR